MITRLFLTWFLITSPASSFNYFFFIDPPPLFDLTLEAGWCHAVYENFSPLHIALSALNALPLFVWPAPTQLVGPPL